MPPPSAAAHRAPHTAHGAPRLPRPRRLGLALCRRRSPASPHAAPRAAQACQLRAFELTCSDKVTLPASLSAFVQRLYALPAVAAWKENEKALK